MHKIKEFVYSGPLSEPIRRYVAEKRAVGYNYNKQGDNLLRLDRYAASYACPPNTLPKEMVIAYAKVVPGESPHTQQLRINILRNLAVYMVQHDYEAYVLPREYDVVCAEEMYVPYIFTHHEIKRILEQVDTLQPHICSPNRDHIAPLLFRMLYGCGLRVSEALNLLVEDVNLTQGVLFIRDAKHYKDRWVPMADSLSERCRVYMRNVHAAAQDSTPFFPNVRGDFFSSRAIYEQFRLILSKAGISHGGRGNGPRVHDLRHTFSVHCLKRWVAEGGDITSRLPYLSAYLGHGKISATGRYLRLTIDLFPHIEQALSQAYPDLIPKLEVLYGDH